MSTVPAAATRSDDELIGTVAEHYGFRGAVGGRSDRGGEHLVFLTDEQGVARTLRISDAADTVDAQLETAAAQWVQQVNPDLPILTPLPTLAGDTYVRTPWLLRLYERWPTTEAPALTGAAVTEFGTAAARLGIALRGFFHPALRRRDAPPSPVWPTLRAQPVVDPTPGGQVLSGLAHDALVAAVAAALGAACAARAGGDLLTCVALFLDGYLSVCPLEPVERQVLADTLRRRLAAAAAAGDAAAERMLADLLAADPADTAAAFGAPRPAPSPVALRRRRDAVFGSALAPLTYDTPLTPVRGCGATLLDADGVTYIDAYNNVPVVGHAHPRVATAVADQSRLLSTNLRYLHPRAIELAERLIASLPADCGLDTVLFTNSGSEAVDIAWRIATATTGHTGGLVTDFAYHGVTTATTAFSPEQWRGGWTPDHIERFTPGSGLDTAVARLADRGHRPALLCVDPTYTSDGILVPGDDYHRRLSAEARRAGALVLADEVQGGFGRAGDHLWSFVGAGLTPDLVTLGKPMGNGYPVAAVIARRDHVEALARQTEFFSTYAGGPVAAVAAMAVLDVIEDESLIEHAAAAGALLRDLLGRAGLEVRGRGLLVGVQLGSAAGPVLNEARRRGVLIGGTGARGDVLKIRPPLVITTEQIRTVASVVIDAIDSVAGQHR